MRILLAIVMLAVASSVNAEPSYSDTYGTLVDTHGNISLPGDLQRRWEFLGTWSIAGKELSTVAALHNVYIQPDAVTQYRKTGQFPDGTVIVKELIKTATSAMTTGT